MKKLILMVLVLAGGIIPCETYSAGKTQAGAQTWGQLIRAMQQGNLQRVKDIVPSKIKPWEKTKTGRTLVSIAQFHHQPAIVAYLNKVSVRPTIIKFYERNRPFYEFTNFATGYPFNIDNKVWPTSEHYFQAQKFKNAAPLQEKIRRLPTPRAAFDEGRKRSNARFMHPDWEQLKDITMLYALRAKFGQHASLRGMLLNTDSAVLIEATGGKDIYWGVDGRGFGYNRLGTLLMHVRNELRTGMKSDTLPQRQKKKWF